MKTKTTTMADPDLRGAGRALQRAAAQARRLAEETGTPLYVIRSGRVVDLHVRAAGAYVLREGRPRK